MDDQQLLTIAETLGIPWRRLIESEVNAEREVRRCLGQLDAETPLWRVLAALQMSVLDSWRVRERVAALAWEARAASGRSASRDLRALCDHLSGKQARAAGEDLLVQHLQFAHRRILELQQAARAAEKSRGAHGVRVRRVTEETGCVEADARWAVDRALAPRERTIVEDAVQKGRSEGFEIPRGETEFRSWMLLRRLVRDLAAPQPRRSRRPPTVRPAMSPAPAPVPAWGTLRAEARFPIDLGRGSSGSPNPLALVSGGSR